MSGIQKRVALGTLATLAFVVVGLRSFLFARGNVIDSFEWYVPPLPQQVLDSFWHTLRPWEPQNFGFEYAYPSMFYINVFEVPFAWLGGAFVQKGLVFAVFSLSAIAYATLLRAIVSKWWVAAIGSLIYSASPFVVSQVAAGHTPYFGSIVTAPIVFLGFIKCATGSWRSRWLLCASTIIFGAQFQAPILLIILMAILSANAFRSRSAWIYVASCPLFFLAGHSFWIVPLVLHFAEKISALQELQPLNVGFHLVGDSRFIIDALRLEPYAVPVTYLYMKSLGIAGIIASQTAYIVPIGAIVSLGLVPADVTPWKRKLIATSGLTMLFAFLPFEGLHGAVAPVLAAAYAHLGFLSLYREVYHYGFIIAFLMPMLFAYSVDRLIAMQVKAGAWIPRIAASGALIGCYAWTAPFWLSGNVDNWLSPEPLSTEYAAAASEQTPSLFRRAFFPNAGDLRLASRQRGNERYDGIDPFLIYGKQASFGNWLPLNALGVAIDNSLDSEHTDSTLMSELAIANVDSLFLRPDAISMFDRDNYETIRSAIYNLQAKFPNQIRNVPEATTRARISYLSEEGKTSGGYFIAAAKHPQYFRLSSLPAGTGAVTFEYRTESPAQAFVLASKGQISRRASLAASSEWSGVSLIVHRSADRGLCILSGTSGVSIRRVQTWRSSGYVQNTTLVSGNELPGNGAALIAVDNGDWVIGSGGLRTVNDVASKQLLFKRPGRSQILWQPTGPRFLQYKNTYVLPRVYLAQDVFYSGEPLQSVADLSLVGDSHPAVVPVASVTKIPSAIKGLKVTPVTGLSTMDRYFASCTVCRVIEPGKLSNDALDVNSGWVSGNVGFNWIGYYNSRPPIDSAYFLITRSNKKLTLQLPNLVEGERVFAKVRLYGSAELSVTQKNGFGTVTISDNADVNARWVYLGVARGSSLEFGGTGLRIVDQLAFVPKGLRPPPLVAKSASSSRVITPIDITKSVPSWSHAEATAISSQTVFVVRAYGTIWKSLPLLKANRLYRLSWNIEAPIGASVTTSITGEAVDGEVTSQRQDVVGGRVTGEFVFDVLKESTTSTISISVEAKKSAKLRIQELSLSEADPHEGVLLPLSSISPSSPDFLKIASSDYGSYNFHLTTSKPRVLVLSENYDPQWHIYNSKGQQIDLLDLKVNGFANGLFVPGGIDDDVHLDYEPGWEIVMARAISLALLIGGLIVSIVVTRS